MHVRTATLVLALAMTPGAATPAEEDCDQLRSGSLYPAEITQPDAAQYEVYRDWLCTQDFATHRQALAEGLPEGALVYGIPLGSRGVFPRDRVSDWKERSCPEAMDARTVERIQTRFRRLADRDSVDSYRDCVGDAGLVCSARVEGEFAVFRASYLEFRRSDSLIALRVDGEETSDAEYAHGHPIDADGITYAHKLPPEKTSVGFELETRGGSCTATARVERDRRATNRYPRANSGARRRP